MNSEIVIVNKTNSKNISLFCDVCSLIINTSSDIEYVNKYNCCESCAMKWAECRKKEWKNGWRPKKEDIDDHKLLARIIRVI